VILLATLLLPAGSLLAHPDIDIRIEAVSAEILLQPNDASLRLRRAELYRHHEDWPAAAADYSKARELAPEHPELDFFEARYFLASGEAKQALARVSRFISNNPDHVSALVTRAGAHQQLGQCRPAAADLARAIELSTVQGPELYLQQAGALLMPGCNDHAAASRVLHAGIDAAGPVPGLIRVATSTDLARGQPGIALNHLALLPPALAVLPPWRYRRALALCLNAENQVAERLFVQLLSDIEVAPQSRQARWSDLGSATADLLADGALTTLRCSGAAERLVEADRRAAGPG
jgi:tetratricopeptide (TPR) repeat protein